jgi:hypothetical protein
MSGPSIRVTRDFYAIRVFINDLLHIHIKTSELLGVHSWIKPALSIEFVMRGGTMVVEYDSREKFEQVLCGIEGII